jgi:hypothetical protein
MTITMSFIGVQGDTGSHEAEVISKTLRRAVVSICIYVIHEIFTQIFHTLKEYPPTLESCEALIRGN